MSKPSLEQLKRAISSQKKKPFYASKHHLDKTESIKKSKSNKEKNHV